MKPKKKPKQLPSCFEASTIKSIVTDPGKRREFEVFFLALSSEENKQNFLKEFLLLKGEAGEWNFLSSKFKNDTLKKVSKQKHIDLMKTLDLQPTVTRILEKPVVKKENLMQMIFSFFARFLRKTTV